MYGDLVEILGHIVKHCNLIILEATATDTRCHGTCEEICGEMVKSTLKGTHLN